MIAKSSLFAEVRIPLQRIYGEVVFAAVLSLTAENSDKLSILTAAMKEQKPWLENLLHKHGAIMFRGFGGLATASNFNEVVEAFEYDEFPYVGGAAPRSNVVGRIYTANESPPEQKSLFITKWLMQASVHPSKLFLFCESEATSGGETPIVLSHIVYEKMQDKYPDFVEKLEKHGLVHTRVMGAENNPSSAIGRDWKSTFWTTEKSVVD